MRERNGDVNPDLRARLGDELGLSEPTREEQLAEQEAQLAVDGCDHAGTPDVGERRGACTDCIATALAAHHPALTEAEVERIRETLADLIGLADQAMREANNDGAEYDRKECLAEARAVLALLGGGGG